MSESKKELIEEHKRLTYILKNGSSKERLEEYKRQMKELKHLLATGKYKPEVVEEKVAKAKVDASHHVPYLGGYSKDGSTIYIDSRFPKTIKLDGKKSIDAHKYLVIHEVTEKHLEEMGFDYNSAHNMAEATQNAALELDGHDPKDYYGVYYVTYNNTLREFDPKKVPEDLDLKPYEDDKLDSVIERIKSVHLNKAITPDPKYPGTHYAKVDGEWYRVKNIGVDPDKPPVPGYSKQPNWYELEGHPEGSVRDNRIENYWQPGIDKPKDLVKSNYGPKGAGLYDPTVNQKRKAKNVDSIEGIGPNRNIKEYTPAIQGTLKQQAATQAKKDLAANKRQPVKTEKDLSPEEREKKLAEFQTMYAKSEDTCKLPPVETFIEHQMKQPMFSSQLPPHLQRISIMESSSGKNKEHAEVKEGVHKGTRSVSAFGLMPKYIKEVAEKFKPLKNSTLGKLILSSDVDQVNNLVSNHEHDSELANHIWNYNQSRLSQHTVDPSHLEALGVAAHRRGVTGALKLYKEGGINAVYNDPYVKTYHNIKDNEVALEKANAKLQLLRSALEKATHQEKPLNQLMTEIQTRQPTDAEINRIMNAQNVSNQSEVESKAAEERYRLACEDVE